MSKEVWVCVGKNDDELMPTWFYVFKSPEQSEEFVDRAHNERGGDEISWEIYPCQIESPKQAIEDFRMCLETEYE